MATNSLSIFHSDSIVFLKSMLLSSMRSELMICSSSSSTEEDQKVYARLASCLQAEVVFEGTQISAKFGINTENLTPNFLTKYRGLIDSVKQNITAKGQSFFNWYLGEIIDQDKIKEKAVSESLNIADKIFGGELSA